MKSHLVQFFLLAAILAGLSFPVFAEEATVIPILDTTVSEAAPERNYANSNLLVGRTGGQEMESFLRFDLSDIPVNAEITAAELRLSSPDFGTGATLRVSRPDSGWGEVDLSWSNKPDGTPLDDIRLMVDDPNNASLSLSAPILSYLQDVVGSVSPNRGLSLSFPTAGIDQLLQIQARESDHAPELVITFAPGPGLPDFRVNLAPLDDRLRAELFPAPDGATTPFELVWNTKPGVRYRLSQSSDLEDWSIVPGYPVEADALGAMHEVPLEADGRFFQVEALDEQPPEIVSRFPDDGDFGIKRFYPAEELGVRLSDVSGIDPAGVSLDLEGLGTFVLSDSELTLEDGLLTLDLGGDTALGGYGATVAASLTVADPLGNSVTHDWSFTLEREVILADGLFTFGSPDAQRAGQRVPAIPTRMLAERLGAGGPIRANDHEWTLDAVTADSVVIAYSGETAPVFAIDQYLTNLTPATVDEVFYRKVTSIADDTVAKRLTLGTVDVPSWEVIQDASLALSPDDLAYEVDGDGRIIRAYALKSFSASKTFTLQPLQVNWADKSVFGLYDLGGGQSGFAVGLPIPDDPPAGDDWQAKVNLKQALLRLSPEFSVAVDLSLFQGLKKLRSETEVGVDLVLEPELEFISPGIDYTWAAENSGTNEPLIKYDIIIPLGTTPLWITVSPRLRMEASLTAGLTGKVSAGLSGGYSRRVIVDYEKDRTPSLEIENVTGDSDFDLIEPEIFIGGTIGGEVKVKPELDVKLNSLAGFYVNLDPTLGQEMNLGFTNGSLISADTRSYFEVNLNAGLSVFGVDQGLLPSFEPWELFTWEKRWAFPETTAEDPLAILVQPQGRTVEPGANVTLEVQANHSDGVSYVWRQDGRRLYNNLPTLRLDNVTSGATGDYQVTLSRAGSEPVTSEVATVTVGGGGSGDPNMVTVQGGTLAMSMGTRTVDTFQIGKYEVTWGEWTAVRAEAAARGYDIANIGAGCADDHPVHSLNWYDVVKWCNLRSEIEGLTPVYTINGATYKSGQSIPTQNLTANGYRLPGEAEWEFAARGGNQTNGYTYSGSNTIDDVAWYRDNSSGAACPLSSGRGTWPVGQKNANELGLHDMSGNVWEWCWDASGPLRRRRGGSWNADADSCAVSVRAYYLPALRYYRSGFRLARSSGN